MPQTANQPRPAPRLLPTPELLHELRADKGPKHISFDGGFLGAGRRAVELAKKADRKR